ncbi:hypothetical protein MPSEU_001020800 [Mayamaea pseudoterrestris]|nr:hypothetical protein MPSEU_001020800 [Mayamaea pseudoterrestris]
MLQVRCLLPLSIVLSYLVAVTDAWTQTQIGNNRHTSRLAPLHAAVNNNIVLEPSSSAEKFDSWKVGNARVHRYARDAGDSEIEYVMWFHGRSKEMDVPTLPPLSTGRIGRATSKNGLVWVKDEEGSASEDTPGVSLGLNKESWWSFDTSHVGLGNVLLPMSTPAVLSESGVYLMYFMGGNYEDSKIADYMVSAPESVKDASIQGMKMRIGVAISQDGISWGRVEGDDPTGAVMVPHDLSDPNVKDNTPPKNMPEELYCAWPEVVVNLDAPKDEAFLMYYSTMMKDTKEKCIARAVSGDGFRWQKAGVCLRPDDAGLDSAGIARCCVIRDADFDESSGKWNEKGSWTMYYEGVSPEDNKHRIMKATSRDTKSWSKNGIALDVGDGPDAWDFAGVGSPHVLRIDDGSLRMYYTGQGPDGSTAIGVAKLVTGSSSGEWTREQATISFAI